MEGHCLWRDPVSSGDHKEVNLCHCRTMCRRWSAGPMFAVHGGKEVRFTGIAPVAYRFVRWAERGFCPTCGTHLFLPSAADGRKYILCAGLFQEQGVEPPGRSLSTRNPDFYALKNDTRPRQGSRCSSSTPQTLSLSPRRRKSQGVNHG